MTITSKHAIVTALIVAATAPILAASIASAAPTRPFAQTIVEQSSFDRAKGDVGGF
ncbi:MAG: hypothetical protein HY056_09025 [Proteobacteria bacterium]|nr:hypothetical protein [Pseudomonadota bacterium]